MTRVYVKYKHINLQIMDEIISIRTEPLVKLYKGETFAFLSLLLALNLMSAAVNSGTEDGG